ncbi:MAG: HPF/RaiA family ribosome-associated protein [Patescibacteria group bacterium]
MKIKLKATNTTLTSAIREWVDLKLVGPVERLVGKKTDAVLLEIDFGKSTKHHKKGDIWFAEANLTLGGAIIRVESSASDAHAAIDNVARELKEDIKKFTSKKTSKARAKERSLKGRIKRTLA